jgi:hypothetical protein
MVHSPLTLSCVYTCNRLVTSSMAMLRQPSQYRVLRDRVQSLDFNLLRRRDLIVCCAKKKIVRRQRNSSNAPREGLSHSGKPWILISTMRTMNTVRATQPHSITLFPRLLLMALQKDREYKAATRTIRRRLGLLAACIDLISTEPV